MNIEKAVKEQNVVYKNEKNKKMADIQDIVSNVMATYMRIMSNDYNIHDDFGETLMRCLKNPNGQKNTKENSSAVTGKRFGRRLTYRSYKSRTSYYENYQLFGCLIKDHIDLIKRPVQRQVAQDFLKFRDSYWANLDKLQESIMHIKLTNEIPIKMKGCQNISIANKQKIHIYLNNSKKYKIFTEEIVDYLVTDVIIFIDDLNTKSYTSTGVVNINFLGRLVGDSKNTYMISAYDIKGNSIEKSYHYYGNLIDKLQKLVPGFKYSHYNEYYMDSDIAKVFESKEVQSLLADIDNFFRIAHKTLKHIEMKHANRILMNGLF